MAIAASSLFGVTSAANSVLRRSPAAASADGLRSSAGATKASGAIEDKVEVGSLGKSLKGVAADVFASLGSKGRAHLEGMVKNGGATVEEISLGLRALATASVRERFLKERPKDAEDEELEAQRKLIQDASRVKEERIRATNDKLMAVGVQFIRGREGRAPSAEERAAHEEEMGALRAEIESANKDYAAAVGEKPRETMASIQGRLREKGEEAYEALGFGDSEDGFLALDDERGKKALQKMVDRGLVADHWVNGLKKYTANVDIAGLEQGTYVENPRYDPASPDSKPTVAAGPVTAGPVAVGSDALAMLDQAAKTAAQASASKGLPSMGQVSREARDSLDAGYRTLSEKGKANGVAKGDEESIRTVFAGLDRRSLFAVASNSGRLFSKAEQEAAQNLMAEQQAEAMKKGDPKGTDKAAGFRAAVAFLDSVSDEEKASANWAVQRAANQLAHENLTRAQGKPSTVADSANPIARMIKKAMETGAQQGKSFESMLGGSGYVKDLKAMPLFRDGMPKITDFLDPPVNFKV
ncbi:hypothetical protein J2847_000358 [Azospirillum agricola]|uniref:hypothetical protein n=1 Tax=Azospirillum agricola TaxID=1720247 RepID=UPI001AE5EB40|nr:hypothetical protein [Azospirillum agricola]MBP2227091.1 hypothetical protein [Azospirillum agricola]